MNSLVSFSMCPSYRLVVRFIRPILDRPKSVSLMWPIDVINRLEGEVEEGIRIQMKGGIQQKCEKIQLEKISLRKGPEHHNV